MAKTSTSYGEKAGNPRNTTIPGPGRPSKYVRERAAWSWEQRIPRLEKIADGDDLQAAIAAMRELRAVGFAERIEHSGSVQMTAAEREDRLAHLLGQAKARIPSNGNGKHVS